jgi:hypothetical protein
MLPQRNTSADSRGLRVLMGPLYATKMIQFDSFTYQREDDRSEGKDFLLIGVFVLVIGLGHVLQEVNTGIASFLLISAMLGLMVMQYKDWRGQSEPSGIPLHALRLTATHIELASQLVSIEQITEMKLQLWEVKGEKHRSRWGYRLKSGTKNQLYFKTQQQTYNCHFMIASLTDRSMLEKVVEHYYRMGLPVKDFYQGNRTYLFKDLDYSAIQAFKKEYKIK